MFTEKKRGGTKEGGVGQKKINRKGYSTGIREGKKLVKFVKKTRANKQSPNIPKWGFREEIDKEAKGFRRGVQKIKKLTPVKGSVQEKKKVETLLQAKKNQKSATQQKKKKVRGGDPGGEKKYGTGGKTTCGAQQQARRGRKRCREKKKKVLKKSRGSGGEGRRNLS